MDSASSWSTLGGRRSASKGRSAAPARSSRVSEANQGIYSHGAEVGYEQMKADPDAARGMTVQRQPPPSLHRWPSVERRPPTKQKPSPQRQSVERRPPTKQKPNPRPRTVDACAPE